MIFYKLDYTIEKTLQQNKTAEQKFLQKYTTENFTKAEAKFLFEKVSDHKWYVSERLQRDIGLAVAAVDYFENFYEPKTASRNSGRFHNSKMKVYEKLSLTA
jgi:hypothetical protein